MAKGEATIEELVGMIERGELRLPEMQRHYVWRSPRVRDLLDSLYRGYPSGAILLWETGDDVPLQAMSVAQSGNPFQATRLLLDGQQRLTSLSAVIRGVPVEVRGRQGSGSVWRGAWGGTPQTVGSPMACHDLGRSAPGTPCPAVKLTHYRRQRPIELLFNLDHPDELVGAADVDEEANGDADGLDAADDEADASDDELQRRFDRMTFVVATKTLEQLPQWVKVTDVFRTEGDRPFLKRAGVKGFDDPRYERYNQRLAKLRGVRKYLYRMDILERSLSYEQVTETFVRVNSLGAKLRSSDLALAQITAKWRGALKTFLGFEEQRAARGFDLDLGISLKNLIAFATGQSRFLTVSTLKPESLQAAWKESVKGMEFAVNFVSSNAGIDSPALLSSAFLLIALGSFGHRRSYKISSKEEARLRDWVLVANTKGRYSRGSCETLLDQDLATIRDGGGAAELFERLRVQVGVLDVTPEELAGRNARSAFFKTMFLAFRAAGAKDWTSNLAIGFSHAGATHRLQFHHIFPKALLKGHYTSREADDIANLAFIGGRTNRSISAKQPATCIPAIVEEGGSDAFAAQCIPTDPALLRVEHFKEFLAERRQLMAVRLNGFLPSSSAS